MEPRTVVAAVAVPKVKALKLARPSKKMAL
jgi:hypothetical protein